MLSPPNRRDHNEIDDIDDQLRNEVPSETRVLISSHGWDHGRIAAVFWTACAKLLVCARASARITNIVALMAGNVGR